MQKEEWRAVEGYEGLYEVSNSGRVRSFYKGKVIDRKLSIVAKYYPIVHLFKNKKRTYHLVHILMAKAFLGECPEGYEVDHIIPLSKGGRNVLENIRYLPVAENRSRDRKKPVLQYTLEGVLIKEWKSVAECQRNGFHQGHVSACCLGKLKQHKGFIWKYKPQD